MLQGFLTYLYETGFTHLEDHNLIDSSLNFFFKLKLFTTVKLFIIIFKSEVMQNLVNHMCVEDPFRTP